MSRSPVPDGDGSPSADPSADTAVDTARVHCRLTELLEKRGLAVTELSALVGVSPVNLSVLKNDRAKAIRFSTLIAICDVLECGIGDLLVLRRD